MYHLIANALVAAVVSQTVAVAPERPASCAVENQPAAIVHAVPPEYPTIAKEERLAGTTVIQIDLASDGTLVGAYVAKSSGSVLLDQAAVRTAKDMAYAPETRGCQPVSGSYKVEVEFND